MTQVIRTESPDNSGTNTILIVLLLAAVVAFGVWFFSTNGVATPASENPGINLDVNLPAGGTQEQGGATGENTGTIEP